MFKRVFTAVALAIGVLSCVLGLSAAGLSVALHRAPDSATFVGPRDTAITALLDRRAKAVQEHKLDDYLADVDRGRPELVEAETRTFENLSKMPFAAFGYTLSKARYRLKDPARFGPVVLPGVTLRYRIEGVDDTDTATPYLPILSSHNGRWFLVGEATDKDVDEKVPFGIGAQPWQGDPIAVRTTAHGVLVYSPADEERSKVWARWIEDALAIVKKFRPDKWSGKVFVVAVRDKKLITEHLGADTDKTAAIAAPRYDRIPAWTPGDAQYAGTVVLFNPDQLNEADEEILATIVHEFTHAALNPVTSDATPRWLVEGTAVYVEFGKQVLGAEYARKHLSGKDTTQLPADDTFYDAPENYDLSLLACKLIAQKYGEKKLIALYEWFEKAPDASTGTQDQGVRAIIGIPLDELTAQWRRSVQDTIAG